MDGDYRIDFISVASSYDGELKCTHDGLLLFFVYLKGWEGC